MVTTRGAGNPLYYAPEILSGGRHTHESDVYSLGITALVIADASGFRAKINDMGPVRKAVEKGLQEST